MLKQNNKGFTLIEMLAVVAVIAVLVAVIVPIARPPIIKSRAAADAANLRILISEASADYVVGETEVNGMIHFTAPDSFKVCGAPSAKTSGYTDKPASVSLDPSTGLITAKYGSQDLSYFVRIAQTGKLPDAASK